MTQKMRDALQIVLNHVYITRMSVEDAMTIIECIWDNTNQPPCIPIPYPYNPTEPYVTYTSGGNTLEPKGPAKEEDVSCGTLS